MADHSTGTESAMNNKRRISNSTSTLETCSDLLNIPSVQEGRINVLKGKLIMVVVFPALSMVQSFGPVCSNLPPSSFQPVRCLRMEQTACMYCYSKIKSDSMQS